MKVTRFFAALLQVLFCVAISNAQIPDSIVSACDIDPYSFVGEVEQEIDYGVDKCLFWFDTEECKPFTIMDSIPADQSQSGMLATVFSKMFENSCIPHADGLATWIFGSLFETDSNNVTSDRATVFDILWDRLFTIKTFSIDWFVHEGIHANQPEKVVFALTDRAGRVIEKDSFMIYPSQYGDWQTNVITFRSEFSSKHARIVMLPVGNTHPDKPSAFKFDNAKAIGDFGCKELIQYKGWDTPEVRMHSGYTDYIYHLVGEDCNWNFHYVDYVLRVEQPKLSIQCPEDVTVQCGSVLELYPYGLATVQSTCDSYIADISVHEIYNDDCDDILTAVIKYFSAIDNYGNDVQCRQQILVQSPQFGDDREISWPEDVTISACYSPDMDYPAEAGLPYADKTCGHYIYSIDTISIQREECTTVMKRSFVAIDCCRKGWKAWGPTQTITFVDEEAPKFVILPRDTILYTDRCDGIDIAGNIAGSTLVNDCHSIAFSHTIDDGPIQSGWGPKWFDIGDTKVTLIATDQCEYKSIATFTVTVIDRVKPTIICYDRTLDLLSPSGVEFWASDFSLTGEDMDGCGATDSLLYTFSLDRDETGRLFTCDDLGPQTLIIYAWDDDLNRSSCQATLTITDSKNLCSPVGSKIVGNIYNHDMTEMMENVTIEMSSRSELCLDGNYEMTLTESDRRIQAYKDSEYLYKVSTLDLIKIQRHILGVEPLQQWQRIAADVNNDGKIDGRDLVELRKLILGVYEILPNSRSCRCFETSSDAERVYITDPSQDQRVDWRCIKIGDVDSSHTSLGDDDPVVQNLHRYIDKVEVAVAYGDMSQNTGENDNLTQEHQNNTTATVETNQNTKEEDMIQLYPNPVMNTLQVRLDGVFLYEVRDSQKSILMQGVGENNTSIDVYSLTSSIYFLRLIQGNEIITKSFIKI